MHLRNEGGTDHCDSNKYVFITITELNQLCVCETKEAVTRLLTWSYAYVGVSLVGIVAVLLTLTVTSTMITRASTAVLLSVLMLYNILRFFSAGMLATFTLVHSRESAQKIANYLWIQSVWGVHYTMLDLSLEQVISVLSPNTAHRKLSPMKAVKRTLLVMVLGVCACCIAFIHAIDNPERGERLVDCHDPNYYNVYTLKYSLYFMLLVIWALPNCAIATATISLCAFLTCKQLGGRGGHVERYLSTSPSGSCSQNILVDYHWQQVTTLCILVSHVVLNLLANIQWLKLASVKEPKELGDLNDSRVKLSQVAEMLALVSGVITPVFCFLWPRFRDECRKVLSINTEVPTRSFVSTRSRSVVSFR